LENAGGRVTSQPSAAGEHAFDVRMWNGKLRVEDLEK
jgi:hypothetical protein